MSVKDEQAKNLEKEVVVTESEATDLVEINEEAKKTKVVKVAKKVGKIAAIAGVGLLGYFLGTKAGSKADYEYDDDSEIIDAEVIEIESDVE